MGQNLLNQCSDKKNIEEGIRQSRNIYTAGVKRISNKKIKRALIGLGELRCSKSTK